MSAEQPVPIALLPLSPPTPISRPPDAELSDPGDPPEPPASDDAGGFP
ncbi:hypothetical protein [Sorangium sp. So ce1024]